jgi:hypothetical protein
MKTTMIYDLDDTLFDHRYSQRCGFETLRAMHPALMSADILDRESVPEQLICANYEKFLDGAIPLHGAMTERICTLCTRLSLMPLRRIYRKRSGASMLHSGRNGGPCREAGNRWNCKKLQ